MSLFIPEINHKAPISSCEQPNQTGKELTFRIMNMIKPYFLAPYTAGTLRDRKTRQIQGKTYSVERANHGLAHALRQGALAKDIFRLLAASSDSSGIAKWARRKNQIDSTWIAKLEMAASFQRSGRQCECSSASNPELYKKYELQDVVYFKTHAERSSLFQSDFEVCVFAEAIMWANCGILDEDRVEDLKYTRRILHTAHTLDLRRILGFNGARIQKDAMNQLFGSSLPQDFHSLLRILWDRSGDYLQATGDRDLVSGRHFQDQFFIQSCYPEKLAEAVCIASKNLYPKMH